MERIAKQWNRRYDCIHNHFSDYLFDGHDVQQIDGVYI